MTSDHPTKSRRPIVMGLVGGTLVHTRDGLKALADVEVGDWVLSHPDSFGAVKFGGFRRVVKKYRYEAQQIANYSWCRNVGDGEIDHLFGTVNLLTWNNPRGWMRIPEVPGSTVGPEEYVGKNIVLADGSDAESYEFQRLYRTDRPEIAFMQEDGYGFGNLVDLSASPHEFLEELQYDYAAWGNPATEAREYHRADVFQLQIEDWHTFCIGRTGLWIHDATTLE